MVDSDKYNQEIEYIFRQFPSYQQVGKIAYKEGLETMIEFDRRLGHPHRDYPVIHVAGTNGKGSVSHMLTSALMSCGVRVGLYTSPHLIDFRERIKVNGVMISKEEVLNFLVKWKPFMDEHKPSFFEITTAMAFDHFRREMVEIAVIETGLGGRLDSTNIVTPLVSVITNIALDHIEQLGSTISAIATEKAGIIKHSVPVVIGEYTTSTKEIFESVANKMGAHIVFSQDSLFSEIKATDYELDLTGDCQTHNLRCVLTTLSVLSLNPTFINVVGEGWSDENIRNGLRSTAMATGLRGRWEYLSKEPPVVCDTGHNVNGLTMVFSQLRRQSYKRLFSIVGFVADKDIEKIVGLLPADSYFFFTQAKIARALNADILASKCMSVGLKGEVCTTVESAIIRFKEIYKEGDYLFVGGSTFIVAEAIDFFEKNANYFAK
jgi:dihydrofolate synthase/folylpolyglutamate synthase